MKTIYIIKDADNIQLSEGDIVVTETKKASGAPNGHDYRVVSFTKKKNRWKLFKKYGLPN